MKSNTPAYLIGTSCVIAVALVWGQSDARAQQGTAQVPAPGSAPAAAVAAQTAAQEAATADRRTCWTSWASRRCVPGRAVTKRRPTTRTTTRRPRIPFPNFPRC